MKISDFKRDKRDICKLHMIISLQFFLFFNSSKCIFFCYSSANDISCAVDTITNNFQIQDLTYEEKEDGSIGSFFNLNKVGIQVREITNSFFLSNQDRPLTGIVILLFFYLTTIVISSLIQFAGIMLYGSDLAHQ